MTSMGAKGNESINVGGCPYVFKITGQPCHRIGSLKKILLLWKGRRKSMYHFTQTILHIIISYMLLSQIFIVLHLLLRSNADNNDAANNSEQ
jgi:hypothetical protein